LEFRRVLFRSWLDPRGTERRRGRTGTPRRDTHRHAHDADAGVGGIGARTRGGLTALRVTIDINGQTISEEVEDRTLLVHFVRDVAGLTATNIGCDTTSCGACTVLVDGESVKSCTMLAAQADGRQVTTLEGLSDQDGQEHP